MDFQRDASSPLWRAGAVALVTITVLLFALGAYAQCIPAEPPLQPEDPLEMTTVITPKDLAKTIKVEKEVFLCDLDGDGTRETIRDVNIYTEIIEKLRDLTAAPTKSFEVVSCDKDAGTAKVLSCTKSTPPATLPTVANCSPATPPPGICCECPTPLMCLAATDPQVCFMQGCTAMAGVCNQLTGHCESQQPPRPRPPRDPVVLNAVASKKNVVKSVHVEKEVFECVITPPPGLSVIQDVNIFTEIIEDLAPMLKKPPLPPTVTKKVEVGTCVKDPDTGQVLGCKMEDVPL